MAELQNFHLCLLLRGKLYPLANGASFSHHGAVNLAEFHKARRRIKWGKCLAFNITNRSRYTIK